MLQIVRLIIRCECLREKKRESASPGYFQLNARQALGVEDVSNDAYWVIVARDARAHVGVCPFTDLETPLGLDPSWVAASFRLECHHDLSMPLIGCNEPKIHYRRFVFA